MQRLSTRITAYFGTLFVITLSVIFTLWYAGLPMLGFHGASSLRLAEATRVIELEANHVAAWFDNGLLDRRGDMLNLAENVTLARALSSSQPGELQHNFERIYDRLLRAYPDRFHALCVLNPQDGRILVASDPRQVGKEFPDNSLIVGSPARAIRQLDEKAVEGLKKSADSYVRNWRKFAPRSSARWKVW